MRSCSSLENRSKQARYVIPSTKRPRPGGGGPPPSLASSPSGGALAARRCVAVTLAAAFVELLRLEQGTQGSLCSCARSPLSYQLVSMGASQISCHAAHSPQLIKGASQSLR